MNARSASLGTRTPPPVDHDQGSHAGHLRVTVQHPGGSRPPREVPRGHARISEQTAGIGGKIALVLDRESQRRRDGGGVVLKWQPRDVTASLWPAAVAATTEPATPATINITVAISHRSWRRERRMSERGLAVSP